MTQDALDPTLTGLYVQLFGVGVLWVTIHCGGMCGPIMAGLATHSCPAPPNASNTQVLGARLRGVLAYQSGRGLTYAIFGALAGALGATLDGFLRDATPFAAGLAALIMIGLGVTSLRKDASAASSSWSASMGAKIGRWGRRMTQHLPERGWRRMGLWGVFMGFLPCMLMGWVLSLSIASASPLHGALLMLGLIVLTTPVLAFAACSTSLVRSRRWRALGERLVPFALILSGIWTGLVGMAARGWIEHVHIPFQLFETNYTFMLW